MRILPDRSTLGMSRAGYSQRHSLLQADEVSTTPVKGVGQSPKQRCGVSTPPSRVWVKHSTCELTDGPTR